MEEDKEGLLEEKAKEFIRLKVVGKFEKEGFNPVQIEDVEKYMPAINYLFKKEYLIEGIASDAMGKLTVKSIRYIPTSECIKWAYS